VEEIMPSESSIVGDLINFRGLVYSPINEDGVIFLFGKVAEDLNMYVEEIKAGFPDCVGRRFTGRGWERVSIEFEHLSSNFHSHKHDASHCDIIVCWEHDWPSCPIEVIELKEVIKTLPNPPIRRPDQPDPRLSIDHYLDLKRTIPHMRELYKKLLDEVRSISPDIWIKVGEHVVTFYSPERVFAYTRTRKTTAPLQFFTGGEDIPSLARFARSRGGEKWRKMILRNDSDLQKAIEASKESYKRIKAAIKNNEPTGWYATLDEDEGEEEDEKPTSPS
jgi:hypothetical protein